MKPMHWTGSGIAKRFRFHSMTLHGQRSCTHSLTKPSILAMKGERRTSGYR